MKVRLLIALSSLLASLPFAIGQSTGEEIYLQNCSACHQATGEGVPGAFPPLAGHLPVFLGSEEGREYLIRVLLYGLQGQIEVEGQTFNGVMPAWAQLTDEQIAEVLNYVANAWGNADMLPEGFEPFTAQEVAAARDLGLTPEQVLELRAAALPAEQ